MKDYYPILEPLLKLVVQDYEFSSLIPLRDIFQKNSKLIVVFNHSTPLSWIPAMCLMTKFTCENGGGERTPRSVVDRFFYQVPLLKQLAEYITQSNRPLNFDELVAHFEKAHQCDFVVFPEGSNCFFGHGDQIQEFRSPRFVEIAIRTNSPLLLCIHHGSENWALSLEIKDQLAPVLGFLPEFVRKKVDKYGILSIPLPPTKIPKLKMKCVYYKPFLKWQDLSDDPAIRKEQIQAEALKIHNLMERTLEELKGISQETQAAATP